MTLLVTPSARRDDLGLVRAARQLGIHFLLLRGHIAQLEDWMADHRPSGQGLTVEDVEDAARWESESGWLARALVGAGYLVELDGALALAGWAERQAVLADRLTAEDRYDTELLRARRERDRMSKKSGRVRRTSADASADTSADPAPSSVPAASPRSDGSPHPSLTHPPSPPSTPPPPACAEPLADERSTPEPAADDPVVVTFPVVGAGRRGATAWALHRSHAAKLAEAFPAADVEAEARKALAWIEANPTKRKTPRGMPEFLRAWCAKVQDRGGGRPGPGSGPTPAALAGDQRAAIEAWLVGFNAGLDRGLGALPEEPPSERTTERDGPLAERYRSWAAAPSTASWCTPQAATAAARAMCARARKAQKPAATLGALLARRGWLEDLLTNGEASYRPKPAATPTTSPAPSTQPRPVRVEETPERKLARLREIESSGMGGEEVRQRIAALELELGEQRGETVVVPDAPEAVADVVARVAGKLTAPGRRSAYRARARASPAALPLWPTHPTIEA